MFRSGLKKGINVDLFRGIGYVRWDCKKCLDVDRFTMFICVRAGEKRGMEVDVIRTRWKMGFDVDLFMDIGYLESDLKRQKRRRNREE